jgi:hypothetical protein
MTRAAYRCARTIADRTSFGTPISLDCTWVSMLHTTPLEITGVMRRVGRFSYLISVTLEKLLLHGSVISAYPPIPGKVLINCPPGPSRWGHAP